MSVNRKLFAEPESEQGGFVRTNVVDHKSNYATLTQPSDGPKRSRSENFIWPDKVNERLGHVESLPKSEVVKKWNSNCREFGTGGECNCTIARYSGGACKICGVEVRAGDCIKYYATQKKWMHSDCSR